MKSVATNNYSKFFKLYESAPHLSAYLMDFLVLRMRAHALACMKSAYMMISCKFVEEELAFQDEEESEAFCKEQGYDTENRVLDEGVAAFKCK